MPTTRPRILITAGPTREPIDAVRYLSNRSSGRLGRAIASAAADRGVATTLLLGPVESSGDPVAVRHTQAVIRRFQSTADLQALLAETWPEHDLLIMAAAVADYRPREVTTGKLRRHGTPPRIELEPTPDLLAAAAAVARPDQRLVGFALEPADRLAESATDKLHRKSIHAIVANPLETMDSAAIAATIYTASAEPIRAATSMSKTDFAPWLLDRLGELFDMDLAGR